MSDLSTACNVPYVIMTLESALEGKQHVLDTFAEENLNLRLESTKLNAEITLLREENQRLKDQLSLYESGATSGAMNGQI